MTMSETIATSDDGRYRLRLVPDPDPQNPRRDYEHITYVITLPSRNYDDVDPDGGPLEDGWKRISGRDDAVEIFTRWADTFHGAVVEYDSPHDGPATLWYLMPDGIAEVTDPAAFIRGDIDEYRAWARGEVYGYVIDKRVSWQVKEGSEPADGEEYGTETDTWEEIESCWGYIGRHYAEEAAKEEFADYATPRTGETFTGPGPGECANGSPTCTPEDPCVICHDAEDGITT